MYETESIVMTPEEELVDVLLDFIIVSATLAKKVNMTVKQKRSFTLEQVVRISQHFGMSFLY